MFYARDVEFWNGAWQGFAILPDAWNVGVLKIDALFHAKCPDLKMAQ